MKIASHFFTILLILGTVAAPAQFQVVHDTPNTTTTPRPYSLILNDGSLVTYHWNNDMHILRKYNDLGELSWSKGIPGQNYTNFNMDPIIGMGRDGISGFVFARYLGLSQTPDSLNWNEVWCQQHFNITRFDASGTIVSSYNVEKGYTSTISSYGDMQDVKVEVCPDGGLVMMDRLSYTAYGWIEMTKLEPDGTIQWSKSIGNAWDPLATGPFPTESFDSQPRSAFTIATDGSIYYMEGGEWQGHLRLAKLNTEGELIWMNRFVYGNNVTNVAFDGVKMDSGGNLHASGYLITTVGRFHIFMMVSPDGVLLRSDIYRTPYHLSPWGFGVDAEGRKYHLVRTNPSPFGAVYSQGILICDTLGSPALFKRRADQVVLPNNVFVPLHRMDVHADRVAVTGLLHHEHVDLAFTTLYETAFLFDTDALGSCFLSDTAFAHIPVPLSIMTTEDLTSAASIDISQYFSSSDTTMTLTSLDPEPLVELCDFGSNLLGVELGLDEVHHEIPLVQQTLLAPGDPIRFNGNGVDQTEICDGNGRLIHRTTGPSKSFTISTQGWNAGVYLIRAFDRNGQAMGSQRIILE